MEGLGFLTASRCVCACIFLAVGWEEWRERKRGERAHAPSKKGVLVRKLIFEIHFTAAPVQFTAEPVFACNHSSIRFGG